MLYRMGCGCSCRNKKVQLLGRQWLIMTSEGRQHAVVPRGSTGVRHFGHCTVCTDSRRLTLAGSLLRALTPVPLCFLQVWLGAPPSCDLATASSTTAPRTCPPHQATLVADTLVFCALAIQQLPHLPITLCLRGVRDTAQAACAAASKWWSLGTGTRVCGPLTRPYPPCCCEVELLVGQKNHVWGKQM